MKRTTQITLEFSTDEINGILMRHLQQMYKIKIESLERKDNVIMITGEETTDPEKLSNHIESDIIHSLVPDAGLPRKYEKRNKGFTKAVLNEFKNGHRIPVDVLTKSLVKQGFDVKEWYVKFNLKANRLKKELVEVDPGVFQHRNFYYQPKSQDVIH